MGSFYRYNYFTVFYEDFVKNIYFHNKTGNKKDSYENEDISYRQLNTIKKPTKKISIYV